MRRFQGAVEAGDTRRVTVGRDGEAVDGVEAISRKIDNDSKGRTSVLHLLDPQ